MNVLQRHAEVAGGPLIFTLEKAATALSQLCTRPKADCSKGIVTAGFSQGSHLAAIAGNYDSRIRATFLIGGGTQAANNRDSIAMLYKYVPDSPAQPPSDLEQENPLADQDDEETGDANQGDKKGKKTKKSKG